MADRRSEVLDDDVGQEAEDAVVDELDELVEIVALHAPTASTPPTRRRPFACSGVSVAVTQVSDAAPRSLSGPESKTRLMTPAGVCEPTSQVTFAPFGVSVGSVRPTTCAQSVIQSGHWNSPPGAVTRRSKRPSCGLVPSVTGSARR